MFIKKFFIIFIQITIFSVLTYANSCPKWFPMPTSDGLVVVLPIYDESIIKPDLDCDGVIDAIDNDIDGDGVRNTIDTFPLNPREFIDTDGDGIGNNADTDDDNDGTIDSEDSNPLVNEVPIANAGDDLRDDVNTTIILDASASSDDGNTLTYSWVLTSKPEGSTATLAASTTMTPSFYGDTVGAYRFELLVSDGILTSVKDVVFVNVGRESMLIAFDDGVHGLEPWITDGTVEGTHLLKDINIKNESSDIGNMVDAGDVIYFSLNDNELWKSDGSEEGTVKITTLDNVYNIYQFTMVMNTLYFIDSNNNLWKSDGTEAGTTKINGYYLNPTDLIEYDNELYFSARAGSYGRELWKSDGTEAGTVMVKDIKEGTSNSNPSEFLKVNDLLFFTVIDESGYTSELWKTDGTNINTILVKYFNSDVYINIRNLTDVNGTLFFSADDGIHGRELWKSDGNELDTVMVKDIIGGSESLYFGNLLAVNNLLYFSLNPGNGTQLWKSDGTEVGTVMIKQLGISYTETFIKSNNILYFSYNGSLWQTDGTEIGTFIVKSGFFIIENIIDLNGTLYFVSLGSIWKSDGTKEGTILVKDINNGFGLLGSEYFLTVDNILYFTANDNLNGNELWKSDGTADGTKMIINISTNTYSSLSSEVKFIKMDDSHYFVAEDSNNNSEIWKSDGTEDGTNILKNIYTEGSDAPRELCVMNGMLYFIAKLSYYDVRLWKSDGTETGTVEVIDDADAIQNLIVVGNFIYYTKYRELWKTDGTLAGTSLVKNISEYNLRNFIALDNLLYFIEDNNLWRSDGTDVGTYILKTNVQAYNNFVVFNNFLYFTAFKVPYGVIDLWKTNGTIIGTVRIINDFDNVENLTVVDNLLYYTRDGKLWTSDGTLENKIMIYEHDFYYIRQLTAVNSMLYYVHFEELWINNNSTNIIDEFSQAINIKIHGTLNGELIFNTNDYSSSKLWKTNTTETIQLTP